MKTGFKITLKYSHEKIISWTALNHQSFRRRMAESQKRKAMNIDSTKSQPDAERSAGILYPFCDQAGEAYPSDIIDKMKAANFNLLEGTLIPAYQA